MKQILEVVEQTIWTLDTQGLGEGEHGINLWATINELENKLLTVHSCNQTILCHINMDT